MPRYSECRSPTSRGTRRRPRWCLWPPTASGRTPRASRSPRCTCAVPTRQSRVDGSRPYREDRAPALVAHRAPAADRGRPVRRGTVVRRHVLERTRERPPLRRRAFRRRGRRVRRPVGDAARRGVGAEHRRPRRPPAPGDRDRAAGGAARRGTPPGRDGRPARSRREQRARAEAVRPLRVRAGRRAARVLPAQQHRRARDAPGGTVMEPLVLGIETSCDETGIGIVRGHTLLADAVASSVDEHARFGGVVPEVASRAHLEAMVPTMQRALDTAGVALADVDGIAVTGGPGLSGALLVGVAAAKAYALAAGKPLYGVNHLAAHVAVDTLEHGDLPEPAIALLVSGGHSSLLRVDSLAGDITPLGATIDDAAGEAFDKVARLLGLPFPGGPPIDREARAGDPAAIAFPRGLTGPRDREGHRFDFSFSGLKTAVARWVEARQRPAV